MQQGFMVFGSGLSDFGGSRLDGTEVFRHSISNMVILVGLGSIKAVLEHLS